MVVLREVLAARHIEKRFGAFVALDDVDFVLEEGEVCGLIGENGAGKTTLLRVLLGLMKPTTGAVTRYTAKSYVGYMPQCCRFDGRLNVELTIRFFSCIRKTSPEQSLALCGTLALERSKPVGMLSPGQQKKLQMILAMMGDPEMYVLDEPTAGLDPGAAREMGEIIRDLKSRRKSVLISSHILQDMNDTCTEVAILSRGKLRCHERLASSYWIKTSPVSRLAMSELGDMFPVTANETGTVLHMRSDDSKVPDLVRALVAREVDVLEVSPGGIRNLVQDVLGWEGGVPHAADAV
ncbi:ABC transporter ATP-binding protein [Bacillota bacterium Meth-B3]